MKKIPESHISTTHSVDLIASIVGSKLDIAGEEARRLAITGALPQVTRAFYSRQRALAGTHKVDVYAKRSTS